MRELIFLVIVLLASCSDSEKQQADQDLVNYGTSQQQVSEMDYFFYDGNQIQLTDAGLYDDYELLMQEIGLQREDIMYRAKRVPKKRYLMNQGFEGKSLEDALSDLKNEQLFYFEFEEVQRQDLLKKYFVKKMDQSVSYMSFDIHRDFLLVTEKGDTLEALYSTYERTYHVSPFEKIVIGFPGDNEREKVKLVYRDQLFGKGMLRFSFASGNYVETMLNERYVTANQN